VLRQLPQSGLELADRDGERAGDVSRAVLLGRTHVEHGDLAVPHSPEELRSLDGLHGSPGLEVLAGDLVDLGQARFGEAAQGEEELADVLARESALEPEP